MGEVYTLQEVAKLLTVSVESIRKYIRDGKLERVKHVGRVRITKEALDKFLRRA